MSASCKKSVKNDFNRLSAKVVKVVATKPAILTACNTSSFFLSAHILRKPTAHQNTYSFHAGTSVVAYLNLFFVEGHRFDGEVIEIIHAQSGLDCILQCVFQDKSCRSVNFRKISFINETENCQLLYRIDSEKPQLLYKDERFDYLMLLQPERVSSNL